MEKKIRPRKTGQPTQLSIYWYHSCLCAYLVTQEDVSQQGFLTVLLFFHIKLKTKKYIT